MRYLQPPAAPTCLQNFDPSGAGKDEWKKFKNERDCYNQCRRALAQAQGGLCAYCEIRLRFPPNSEPKLWDFQIEHIWPKSKYPARVLDWSNLLGCCKGGTSGSHDPKSGHKASQGERATCGESKGDIDPSSLLNPYEDLQAQDLVYTYNSKGVPKLHPSIRPELAAKAEKCLEVLNLKDSRLNGLRKKIIDALSDSVLELEDRGEDLNRSMADLWAKLQSTISEEETLEFISVYRDFFSQFPG